VSWYTIKSTKIKGTIHIFHNRLVYKDQCEPRGIKGKQGIGDRGHRKGRFRHPWGGPSLVPGWPTGHETRSGFAKPMRKLCENHAKILVM